MDKYTIDESQYKNGYAKGYEDGKKDAVEVVRCKDCKKYKKEWVKDGRMKAKGYWFCYCDEHENHYPKEDDFCSYGERKK